MTRAFLYVGYLLVVVALIVGVGHCAYQRRLARRALPRGLTRAASGLAPAVWSRLGWVGSPARRTSSFLRFDRRKPAGRIRIGCFGDSLTWGYEVGDGHDYPARLARRLRDAGHRDVEVLNFGVNAYGFHQTYSMWAEVGRDFDLDYVLVLPIGAWPWRDGSFHAEWDSSFRKFHARWVLAGDAGLRRVDVLGDTDAERFARYTALVPPWRYLRYDREPPAFLAALLPAGRTLPNPFYYRDDTALHEARVLYPRLLGRLHREGRAPTVVLLSRPVASDASVRAILAAGRPDGMPLVDVPWGGSFLYEMPEHHASPWANDRIAAQVAWTLGGTDRDDADTVVLHDLPAPRAAPAPILGGGRRVDVAIAGTPVGAFYELRGDRQRRPRRVRAFPDDVQALVAVPLSGCTLADALFVPFARPLASGAPVAVRDGAGRTTPLAPLAAPDRLAGVHGAGVCSAAFRRALGVPDAARCRAGRWRWHRESGTRAGVVLVDGEPVLAAYVRPAGGGIDLYPVERLYRIRATATVATFPDALRPEGTVDLVVTRAEGDTARVPLVGWRRTARRLASTRVAPEARLPAAVSPPRS